VADLTYRDYQRWGHAAHQRIQGWLPADKDTPILDIGCGTGGLLYLLNLLGYTNCTGVDISAEQLEFARQWCPTATIIKDDVYNILPQYSGHFGLITAFDIVEHFRKTEILPLLTLTLNALRPGGRLILQTPNAESPWFGSVAYGDFTHEWFFTPRSLCDILQQVGFKTYEARSNKPVLMKHDWKRFGRIAIWKCLHTLLATWNLAETGSIGSGIYTRVFTATAVKE
jgi:cyclopropane fatty-acyl-phospholipid synthase-like methyltransferase